MAPQYPRGGVRSDGKGPGGNRMTVEIQQNHETAVELQLGGQIQS